MTHGALGKGADNARTTSAIGHASGTSVAALMPDRPGEPNALFVMLLTVMCAPSFRGCRYGSLKVFNYTAIVSSFC
jgi:hypothetical protein